MGNIFFPGKICNNTCAKTGQGNKKGSVTYSRSFTANEHQTMVKIPSCIPSVAYLLIFGALTFSFSCARSDRPISSASGGALFARIDHDYYDRNVSATAANISLHSTASYSFQFSRTVFQADVKINENRKSALVQLKDLLSIADEEIKDRFADLYEDVTGVWQFEDTSTGIETIFKIWDPISVDRRLQWRNVIALIEQGLTPFVRWMASARNPLGEMEISVFLRGSPESVIARAEILENPFPKSPIGNS